MSYVDGFVVPVPQQNLAAYRSMDEDQSRHGDDTRRQKRMRSLKRRMHGKKPAPRTGAVVHVRSEFCGVGADEIVTAS